MLTVATLLWDANRHSKGFSRMYDEEWVHRLHRGFRRNLTVPFRFVCFTERPRIFEPGIEQEPILAKNPDYGAVIEAYRTEGPMILVGLDTVVAGNIDHLATWLETAEVQALPRDPYRPEQACNGVALVPKGWTRIAAEHRGENDMEWVRRYPHVFIDDLWPEQVVSYKGHVENHGLGDARIVYFHGKRKPHELLHIDWVREHWLGKSERPRVALVLGGAASVWSDVSKALDLGEYTGVIACNDAGVHWRGKLDAWVSLHPEKFARWTRQRERNGHPAVSTWAHEASRLFVPDHITEYRFSGQTDSGSSGHFAVKVALEDLGFDKAVLCGIPMSREGAHFFDPKDWFGAIRHRSGWRQSFDHIMGRVRSLSGWTRDMFGEPTADWLAS